MTATTHDPTLGEHEVVKTFRSWDRDEPGREGLREVYAAGVRQVGECAVDAAVREAEQWLASDEAGRLAVQADQVFADPAPPDAAPLRDVLAVDAPARQPGPPPQPTR